MPSIVKSKTKKALSAQIARWESANVKNKKRVKKKSVIAQRNALNRKTFASLSEALQTHLTEHVTRGNLTLAELERQTGLKRQTISRFIKGYSMRLDVADKLAQYFGLVVSSGKPGVPIRSGVARRSRGAKRKPR